MVDVFIEHLYKSWLLFTRHCHAESGVLSRLSWLKFLGFRVHVPCNADRSGRAV
jgi:hypothetical protein